MNSFNRFVDLYFLNGKNISWKRLYVNSKMLQKMLWSYQRKRERKSLSCNTLRQVNTGLQKTETMFGNLKEKGFEIVDEVA